MNTYTIKSKIERLYLYPDSEICDWTFKLKAKTEEEARDIYFQLRYWKGKGDIIKLHGDDVKIVSLEDLKYNGKKIYPLN